MLYQIKNVVLLSILLLLVVQNIAKAQNNKILESSSGKYFFQSNLYNRKGLKEIIKEKPIAYDSYLIGMKKIKRTSQFALIGGFLMGVGYVVNNREPTTAVGSILTVGVDASLYIFGLHEHYSKVRNVFIGSGAIFGIIAIVEHKLGRDLVSESIVLFNGNSENVSGRLEFGVQGSDISIHYVF